MSNQHRQVTSHKVGNRPRTSQKNQPRRQIEPANNSQLAVKEGISKRNGCRNLTASVAVVFLTKPHTIQVGMISKAARLRCRIKIAGTQLGALYIWKAEVLKTGVPKGRQRDTRAQWCARKLRSASAELLEPLYRPPHSKTPLAPLSGVVGHGQLCPFSAGQW
jgi:hypothetical protein